MITVVIYDDNTDIRQVKPEKRRILGVVAWRIGYSKKQSASWERKTCQFKPFILSIIHARIKPYRGFFASWLDVINSLTRKTWPPSKAFLLDSSIWSFWRFLLGQADEVFLRSSFKLKGTRSLFGVTD